MGNRGDRFEFWFIENWWKWFLVIVVLLGVPLWLLYPWALLSAAGILALSIGLVVHWRNRPWHARVALTEQCKLCIDYQRWPHETCYCHGWAHCPHVHACNPVVPKSGLPNARAIK